MALKARRTTLHKPVNICDDDADTILSRIESPNESNVLASLKDYLEPVWKLETSSEKENLSISAKRRVAKQFVPFLAKVLKLCSNGISKLPLSEKSSCRLKANELLDSMAFALDCFEHLRDALVGSPLEIEVQRSWLVRRMIGWKRTDEALSQGQRLLRTLCSRAFVKEVHQCDETKLRLPHPRDALELSQGLVVLVVGVSTDIVTCIAEIGTRKLLLLEMASEITEDIEPWLSELDKEKAEKQRSLLFRELNKCLTSLVSVHSHDHYTLAQTISFQMLHHCAMSSTNDNFFKLVRSMSSRLSLLGPKYSNLAINLCEKSLIIIKQEKQLRILLESHEVLELVECYTRLCQSAKKYDEGWNHVCRAIEELSEESQCSSMMLMTGFYAASLMLTSSVANGNNHFPDNTLPDKISRILQGAIDAVKKCNLTLKSSKNVEHVAGSMNREKTNRSYEVDGIKNFLSTHRALDHLRRAAVAFAQVCWDVFIAQSGDHDTRGGLYGALECCLMLFCKSVKSGLGSDCLTSDDLEIFQRGKKSFLIAASAALKLSLIMENINEESAVLIFDAIGDPLTGLDELRWLMSSSYNMGVQLFNLKFYELACQPFRISYAAAWERVSRVATFGNKKMTEFTDSLSDAFAKTSALIDSLNRINEFQESVEVLRKSLEKWARSGTNKIIPQALLQLWFKRVLAIKVNEDSRFEQNTICYLTFSFSPPLPLDAAGLLLEEELSFYETLEKVQPSLSLHMRQKIIDALLDKVYKADIFPLQRSKILLEKGRIKRLNNEECLEYITDAINVLKTSLNINSKVSTMVKAQLAVGYIIRGIRLQEVSPQTEDFIEDILNGLNICDELFSSEYSEIDANVNQSKFWIQVLASGLLHNLADLLSLKCYTTLQYRVYAILLEIVVSNNTSAYDAFESAFLNRKLSHVLCSSPFLYDFPRMVERKLKLDLNSKACLDSIMQKSPKGFLSLYLGGILKDMSSEGSQMHINDSDVCVWSEVTRALHDSKVNEDICMMAQAFFVLAESNERRGQLEEALHNAKEALRHRLKLLNRNFKIVGKCSLLGASKDEHGDDKQNTIYLEALGPVAVNKWPSLSLSKSEAGPSQWQVIGDYLESLMQVGSINQAMGIVDDAESSFREGCQIANSHGLSFVEGIFSSSLGEIQRKRHLWELSEASFAGALELLDKLNSGFLCPHCMKIAKAVLDLRRGDLERRRDNRDVTMSSQSLRCALDFYVGAERVLAFFFPKCCQNVEKPVVRNIPNSEDNIIKRLSCMQISPAGDDQLIRRCSRSSEKPTNISKLGVPSVADVKSKSKTTNVSSASVPIVQSRYNTRRRATLVNLKLESISFEEPAKVEKIKSSRTCRKSRTTRKCIDLDSEEEGVKKNNLKNLNATREEPICIEDSPENLKPAHGATTTSSRNRQTCWCDYEVKTYKHQCVINEWLDSKWSSFAKRLLARVLVQKAKCYQNLSGPHEANEQLRKAVCVLKSRECYLCFSSDAPAKCTKECLYLKQQPSYPLEESCILYHTSLLALREDSHKKGAECCYVTTTETSEILIWLCRAFLLCREMAPLLTKVARLLAVLLIPTDLGAPFRFSLSSPFLPKGSGSYFHQISIGATTRQHHLSILDAQSGHWSSDWLKSGDVIDAGSVLNNMQQSLRILPRDIHSLCSSIQDDIRLPCSTVCVSLVDEEVHLLLNNKKDTNYDSWLLVSRFETDGTPLSIIFRCPPLSENVGKTICPYDLDDHGDISSLDLQSSTKHAFGSLITKFTSILDESRQSTSGIQILESVEEKCKWWEWRMDLDARLASLLRSMEENWLGPWKTFLLGKIPPKDPGNFKQTVENLRQQLESLSKSGPVNAELIRILSQGICCLTKEELEEGISRLVCLKDFGSRSQSTLRVPSKQSMCKAVQAFLDAFDVAAQNADPDFEDTQHFHREPVVLVLDTSLQALPWESLPVLRKNEVYRMPSLGAMKTLMIQRSFFEAMRKHGTLSNDNLNSRVKSISLNSTFFNPFSVMSIPPTINPNDTYFLLNPSGDLGTTQAAFEEMFKTQIGWMGKVAEVPSAEEIMNGLQRHELFVYFGHGSGDQFLPERRMRRMNHCAAALLMGCSSGRLLPRGDYEAVGVPWSYIMAGCPTAIANLWDVTDGDIDRFSRVLLQHWLHSEHSGTNTVKQATAKSKEGIKEQGMKCQTQLSRMVNNSQRTASNIGDGRDTCRLPNLIGASPVCYGIPTFIEKKSYPDEL